MLPPLIFFVVDLFHCNINHGLALQNLGMGEASAYSTRVDLWSIQADASPQQNELFLHLGAFK
jgi:hypothetical protein